MTQQHVIPVFRYEPTDPNERLGPTLHPVAIFLARHASSPATLRTYREELDQLAMLAGYASPFDIPWHEWPPQQWHALFEARALRVKPSTLVKTGAVLRGLVRALWHSWTERSRARFVLERATPHVLRRAEQQMDEIIARCGAPAAAAKKLQRAA